MLTDRNSRSIHSSTLLSIFLAALAGVGVGAIFFGNRATEFNVTAQPEKGRPEVRQSAPERLPLVVLEAQIARKTPNEVRNHGAHRFAVFNAGAAPLLLRHGAMSNRMRVEAYPDELAPGEVGYVTIAWSPLDGDRLQPQSGRVTILTNDPQNKIFDFVIAEDTATAEE